MIVNLGKKTRCDDLPIQETDVVVDNQLKLTP